MNRDTFDPDDMSPEALSYLGKHIDGFIERTSRMIIIPDELSQSQIDHYKESMRRVKKLVEKLKKGKTSMFIDKEQRL